MKHSLLLAALALPLALSAKAPELVNPAAPLPEAVSSVTPIQGFINTSGDKNPLGVGEITIVFTGSEDVVPNKSVKSELYKEGVLLATSTDAYVDAMGSRLASISFGGAKKAPGWYEVKVAEGQFNIGSTPSPEFSLFYQIDRVCYLNPSAGVVQQLDNVILMFDDVDEVKVNSNYLSELTCLAHVKINGAEVSPEYELSAAAVSQGSQWGVFISFGQSGIAQTMIYPGTYQFNIPEGLVTSYTYGPNYATDPTDVIVRSNPRMNPQYIIPAIPEPTCEPAQYEVVHSIYDFKVKVASGCELLFANNMATSAIYGCTPEGGVDFDNKVYEVKSTYVAEEDTSDGIITYRVLKPGTKQFADEPIVPINGDYALVLADKAFSVNYSSLTGVTSQEWAAPFQFFFKVYNETAVEDVEASADEYCTVYNLQGICVASGIAPAEVNNLPAGLYIVNGKKVMVVK